MLIIEWFPVTYFSLISILLPQDLDGCSYNQDLAINNLMLWVLAPTLLLRFLGLVLMSKPDKIFYQILMIYGYYTCSLVYWISHTFRQVVSMPYQCFVPMKVTTLNLMTMEAFYTFMLVPYLTVVLMLPVYFFYVLKAANH